jgi:cytochrome P450
LSRTVVDIIIETTFGIKAEALKVQEQLLDQTVLPAGIDEPVDFPAAEDAEAFTSIRDLSDSVQIAMGSPVPTLSLKFALAFKKSLISARKYTDRMINERLQSAWRKFSGVEEKGTVKSATDLIVQREAQMARKEGRDIKIDTQVIKDELFGFYMAGQETTSTTLSWAMKYLTANPDVQTKLRTALRESHERAHRNGGLPSAQEMAQVDVPYLEAFIQEVHRVGNSVSSIVRVTTKDAVVLGHVIPKGTDVFMLTNGPSYKTPPLKIEETIRSKTSRENRRKFGVWDEETIGKFIPERWLATNDKGDIFFNPSAGYTHPYGVGPRACFGMFSSYFSYC